MLFGFGNNNEGQLGLGYAGYQLPFGAKRFVSEVDVLSTSNWKLCAAGKGYSYAISQVTNSLYQWGTICFEPKMVQRISSVVSLDADDTFAVVATEEGEVWMASQGKNWKVVEGISQVKKVACGDRFLVALSEDGRVFERGENHFSHLRSQENGSWTEVELPGKATHIAAHDSTSAAIVGGDLYMWGLLGHGARGDQFYRQDSPLKVDLPKAVKKVVIGRVHVAVITIENDLYLWGANRCGQLGLGDMRSRTSPTKINGKWRDVVLGDKFTVALTKDRFLYGWGSNSEGRLGLPFRFFLENRPVPLYGHKTRWETLACGGTHTLVIKS